jgi:hypothetical protein
MFQGDMEQWVRFANTIKLRIAISNTTEIAAIYAEGSGFITDDVLVIIGYLKDAGKQNPFWNLYGSDESGTLTLTNKATCATDYILDYLADSNDPRINFIYEKPESGHLGVPQPTGLRHTCERCLYQRGSNIGPGLLKDQQWALVFLHWLKAILIKQKQR